MAKKEVEMDQLTKDCISAREAGMSYGQWMTLRGAPAIKPKVETTENVIVCVVCGEVMVDARPGKKYCCPACYAEAMRIKAIERYRKKAAQ